MIYSAWGGRTGHGAARGGHAASPGRISPTRPASWGLGQQGGLRCEGGSHQTPCLLFDFVLTVCLHYVLCFKKIVKVSGWDGRGGEGEWGEDAEGVTRGGHFRDRGAWWEGPCQPGSSHHPAHYDLPSCVQAFVTNALRRTCEL